MITFYYNMITFETMAVNTEMLYENNEKILYNI